MCIVREHGMSMHDRAGAQMHVVSCVSALHVRVCVCYAYAWVCVCVHASIPLRYIVCAYVVYALLVCIVVHGMC